MGEVFRARRVQRQLAVALLMAVEAREYVTVARGRGRRWVAAASERGRAWVIERTPTRVRVGYLTGTGRERSIWLPQEAVVIR